MAVTSDRRTVDRPVVRITDRRAEVGPTLESPVPQNLSFLDQLGLWGNLGVSLLGFTGALFVLFPTNRALSFAAALTAVVLGTALGTAVLAASTVPGARTGVPAMMLLRGLFGGRLSYLPTVLNVLQCLGWGTFEIVTIATAAHTVADWAPRWICVLVAGAITTALTIKPLGAIRVLRKYVTVLMVAAVLYLLVQLLRHPLPSLTAGTWSGFWLATDQVVAVAVSFVPLAADYSRHSRTQRGAFAGAFVGYGITQVLCYGLGLLTLVTVATGKNPNIYGAFIAVPVGWLAFAVLALRELDQSFANVYSTAVSVQNLRPRWDRRLLAVFIGVVTTVTALFTDLGGYQNFLVLLGAVFVPLGGVLLVDFFLLSGDTWDYAAASPARWSRIVPWVAGVVAYQLINPGYISWWVSGWQHVDRWLGFAPPDWLSASITSFVVAAALTPVCATAARMTRRRRRHAAHAA
ncbi:MAG TPA: cytosine permease [Mycobacteriales bacterium]